MTSPTNPKKHALMPSTKLRKALRAAGHHLSPVVQVGKEGVTDAVVRQLDDALTTHELVKVKIGSETPEDRFEAAERLGADIGAHIAQVLGRTVLVYRRHPERPRFEAPPVPRGGPATAVSKRRGDAPERGPKRRGALERGPKRRGGPPERFAKRGEAPERGPKRRGGPPERFAKRGREAPERGPKRRGGPPERGAKRGAGAPKRGGPKRGGAAPSGGGARRRTPRTTGR
jgi:RNA-binding protein